jgi:hypothetical protein
VHGAHLYAGHAIDAFIGMNDELGLHLVEARDRTHFDAIREFTSVAFFGDDVSHGNSVVENYGKTAVMSNERGMVSQIPDLYLC